MKAAAAVLPTLPIVICRLLPTASSFVTPEARRSVDCPSSRRGRRRSLSSGAASSADSRSHPRHDDDDDRDRDHDDGRRPWAARALLFSSFDDGVSSNVAARSFLRRSLAEALLRERAIAIEDDVRSSAAFSPCNGPSPHAIDDLERVDGLLLRDDRRRGGRGVVADRPDDGMADSWTTEALRLLLLSRGCGDPPGRGTTTTAALRVLYVPTAMYALDPRSSNSPGRQRQRARADGRKRRDKLLDLLEGLMTIDDDDDDDDDDRHRRRIGVLSTTLDLDDGSLKQPVGSNDASDFPLDGFAALTTWRPHLLYVEGGNTFWLRHCMEKGGYVDAIRDACAGPGGFAVYCGKSAGAIVAGRDVSTATWKGWDDPSVVPGMGTYGDWSDCPGLDLVGGSSFFPHMSDDWLDTVNERMTTTTERRRDDSGNGGLEEASVGRDREEGRHLLALGER
ncbi:hypothetical protein ACHAW5_007155 [Stephanodiscus triporus]|uniref:Uncharacterized protein n=1 Tax=Stephanodiscus triporus TaxID=2934178 RepID=A0ABD3NLL5_9STRA